MYTPLLQRIHHLFRQHSGFYSQDEFSATAVTPEAPLVSNIPAFMLDLAETGSALELSYFHQNVPHTEARRLLLKEQMPLLGFLPVEGKFTPVVLLPKKGNVLAHSIAPSGNILQTLTEATVQDFLSKLVTENTETGPELTLALCFPHRSLYTPENTRKPGQTKPLTRFLQLVASEKSAIGYLYIYAVLMGLISLSLPLGIQSIVSFIATGQVSASVVLLISLLILGILITGGLQVMQLWLVEFIQQRIFAKTAFEFAFRIPRLKLEYLRQYYPPELVNRFFDTISLQKGFAKILVDFSTAVIQIVFGLILLSFYHPYFIFLGIILIFVLGLILRITGPKGIKSSLSESKYKYKLVNWLEEVARTQSTFRLSGYSNLPLDKANGFVNNYLHARRQHFGVLMTQYFSFVGFKTFITGSLLILGCVLVIQQEINIGQFVASEIIIILIMTAVEKIIIKLENVYDVLTSLDKIGIVTDLPIENASGFKLEPLQGQNGMLVAVKSLKFGYPEGKKPVLKDVSFTLQPGERVCLAGANDSGKTTLLHLLLGLYSSYEGSIAYNHLPLRNLNKANLRRHIGDNLSHEQLFDGTLLENLTLGRQVPVKDVLWALENAGLQNFMEQSADGLNTYLSAGSYQLPQSLARKLIVARSLVLRPKFLILDELITGFDKHEKDRLLNLLLSPERSWTLLLISNDPEVMKRCDRVLLLTKGTVSAEGTFSQISENKLFQELIGKPLS
ncbi:peptidase domain-containing ABC transporter [Adhaeribacter terreus]|uniref:Peptidase domain-containing ABC transporter n=1 Tax=Adhaeribacter terreus TaxID=529703 RepID=A0ABW0E9D1_9BACT